MLKKKSPVKKKFSTVATKKRRRSIDPRTLVLIKQCVIGVTVFSLLILLGMGLYYGTRVSFLTISTIEASGGETIKTAEVETVANSVLAGEYIGLVPRRFGWWYPQTELQNALLTIPRLKNPLVNRDGTTLKISYEEYIPYAIWCDQDDSKPCVFIDESGYAFTWAPKLSGDAFPRFYMLGVEPAERQVMMDKEAIAQISQLRDVISHELSLPISYVETDITGDVFMGVSGGGEIKVTLRQSTEETLNNLQSILASAEFSDIKPGTFQYIDLRFGNKIFINETTKEILSASSTASSIETSVETPVATTTDN